MRMTYRFTLLAISAVLAFGGCGEKGDGAATGEAKAGPVSLPKLGLKADAPAGATVEDSIMGEGHLIRGPGLVVSVEVAGASASKTIAAAKEAADMFSPTNMKEDKLADGWVFTFQNKGSAGTNYHVEVRREIGGKAYTCGTMASEAAQADNAVAFCKSLRK